MAEQRKDSRSAASLKVKYKSATVDDFVLQFGTDVSRGGIFIKTKSPLEAGALLKLELQLSTAAAVISGIGRVAWRRVASQDPAKPAGMGIKFIKLEPASQAIVDRIVAERGAESSRFDQTEGAELARPSIEPPASSLRPDRPSSPRVADAPATVRPPAPVATAAAASKPLIAPKAVASAPKPAPAAPAAPAPAAVAASAPASPMSAASRPRIGPAKAAIPSGLFATSSLATPPVAPIEDKRTSFFPPAPSSPAAPTRGGSNASGQLNASRSSAGSVSSPLNRPGNSRAPSTSLNPRPASTATGLKGVFGGPAPSSPLASSTSGMLRPATEVSGPSSSLLPDRSADEMPTAAVPRPPGGRGAARPVQASAPEPSLLDGLSEDLFGEAEGSGAANIDGMFATLEPIEPLGDAPPARGSRPSSPQPSQVSERISPAPANGSGAGRRDSSDMQRGLAAAEAADVDNLFAGLEDNDAPTDQIVKPAPASAVFTRGSARPSTPSMAADLAGDLAGDDAFGEADLLGGEEDKGAPPFDDDDDDAYADDDVPSATAAASEPPMLRLAEPAVSATPEQAKRSLGPMIGLGVLLLVLIVGGAIAFLKPELLVQLGIVSGGEPALAAPVAPPPPVEVPAQPMTEPPATAQPAEPAAAEPAPSAAADSAPIAAAPAEAAGERIEVNITSLPRGADVRVAGVLKGQTPTNVELAIGRETNVTVSAPGYAAQAKLVSAIKGMDPLRYKLEPLPYVLVVVTTPPQAELAVGSVTSVSPAPLALGHISSGVDVAVTKKGYRRMTRNVRLDEFSERDGVLRAEIQVSLSPMPGTEVEAAPAAPEVEVAPEPSSSSSSRRRRNRAGRTPEGAPAPPEPEVEASADPVPEPEAKPEPAAEPAKEPGAPPPPPSLPSLP